MLPNSNLNFKPCCGIRNPRKCCLWNPGCWVLESGIQIKESGIPITIEIKNSTVLQKNTGTQYLESGIHCVESRIQDCAGLFPYMGWAMSMYNYIRTEIYSLKSYDVNFHITRIFEPQALSSAHFFRRYFFYLTPFFAFFSHCGAWSQVNDSYAMKLENLPLNDKIKASCLQHILSIVTNNKIELWKPVRSTSFPKSQ